LVALKVINAEGSLFVSRGDRSGTHTAELALWKAAGLDPVGADAWYREIGEGMGDALNAANAMGAYVLSDRGTWISFANEAEAELEVVDPWQRPYSVAFRAWM
jgi:tungstate transport system substrate-binding protein